MKTISLKQTGQLFWAAAALSLMVAQPLWANESPAAPDIQEESIFQTIKRKANEWLGREQNAQKDEKAVAPQTDKPSQKNSAGQSDGRKVIDTVKKRMQKTSDNVSKSVDRDKKTIKKKFDKLFGGK
ncbi:MAG: hypothetical protein IH802_02980 [Nitrospinae bacterium]|nr:hypothetical protein [Nitrospinota bacterium]